MARSIMLGDSGQDTLDESPDEDSDRSEVSDTVEGVRYKGSQYDRTDNSQKRSIADDHHVRTDLHTDQRSSLQDNLTFRAQNRILQGIRTAQHQINPANLQESHFLLPNFSKDTYCNTDDWELLLQTPIRLADRNLLQMFNMETWNLRKARPRETRTFLYVRSFPIQVRDLRQMVLGWADEDLNMPEMLDWWDITKELADSITLYIRYVGTTESSTPFQRHLEDLQNRDTGVFAKFVDTLTAEFPKVLENAKVYDLIDSRITWSEQPTSGSIEELRALRERALIALFDLPTLLNRQSGGVVNDYEPSHTYARLQNHVQPYMENLMQDLVPCDEFTEEAIRHWAHDKQRFINGCERTTRGETSHISDAFMDAIVQQGLPYLHGQNGDAIMANIGGWVTAREMGTGKGFLEAGSKSAKLLLSIFACISERETLKALFAWVDVWSWMRPSYPSRAIGFLQEYLGMTRPIVIVCHDHETFCLMTSELVSMSGAKEMYLSTVGLPRVEKYGAHDHECAIVIPSLHPGADIYGGRPPEFRRIIHLTVWTILITVQTASSTISTSPNSSKLAVCQKAAAEATSVLQRLGLPELLSREKQTHADVKAHCAVVPRNDLEAQRLFMRKTRLIVRHVMDDTRDLMTVGRIGLLNVASAEPRREVRSEQQR